MVRSVQVKNFDEIVSKLPRLKGNPHAPYSKGTLSDTFNESFKYKSTKGSKTVDISSRVGSSNFQNLTESDVANNNQFQVPQYFFSPPSNKFNSRN
jgi:hypothetical protein